MTIRPLQDKRKKITDEQFIEIVVPLIQQNPRITYKKLAEAIVRKIRRPFSEQQVRNKMMALGIGKDNKFRQIQSISINEGE